jgi:DNA ligase-1
MKLPARCIRVEHKILANVDELIAYEEEQVVAGYEGICFRSPDSPYKHGRSTFKEGFLIKLKRFTTDEAVI